MYSVVIGLRRSMLLPKNRKIEVPLSEVPSKPYLFYKDLSIYMFFFKVRIPHTLITFLLQKDNTVGECGFAHLPVFSGGSQQPKLPHDGCFDANLVVLYLSDDSPTGQHSSHKTILTQAIKSQAGDYCNINTRDSPVAMSLDRHATWSPWIWNIQ